MNERFVISINKGEVSVLDTGHDLVKEEGNAQLFSVDCVSVADAKYIAEELDSIVRILNEQDKELKKVHGDNWSIY